MFTYKAALVLMTAVSCASSALAQPAPTIQALNLVHNPMFERCQARTPEDWTLATTSGDSNCGKDNDLQDYYNQGGTSLLTQHLELIKGHKYALSFQIAFHGKKCRKGYASLTLESGTGGITVNGKTQKTVCEADGEFVMFTGTAVATQNLNAIQVLVGSPEGYYLVTDIKVLDLGLCPSVITASRKRKARAGMVDVPYWAETRMEKRSVEHKAADIAKRESIAASAALEEREESTAADELAKRQELLEMAKREAAAAAEEELAKREALPEMSELVERDEGEAQTA